MDTICTRIQDAPFLESGTVFHKGRAFTAGGALEHEGLLLAYVVNPDPVTGETAVTNWDSTVSFGSVRSTRTFHAGWAGYHGRPRMTALRVRRPDGTMWHGRYGSDWSQLVRLRPCKG